MKIPCQCITEIDVPDHELMRLWRQALAGHPSPPAANEFIRLLGEWMPQGWKPAQLGFCRVVSDVAEMTRKADAEPPPPVTEPTATVQPQATAERKHEASEDFVRRIRNENW